VAAHQVGLGLQTVTGPAMWIDVHAHLYDVEDARLANLVSAANAAGVGLIVNTATSPASWQRVLQQGRLSPVLPPATGISPFDVQELPDDWETVLDACLGDPEVLACGEAGLDSSSPAYPPLAAQLPVLERQLSLAKKHDKPIIVHSRGAERHVLDLCRNSGIAKVLFHCYTGDPETLRHILDAGYYVSYSGIVTFKNKPLDEQVALTPLDRIFIESDSPYLSPVPHRGKPNQPAWVPLTGAAVAAVKKVDPDQLAAAIQGNYRKLFVRP
jgi:TatD DNase family protein